MAKLGALLLAMPTLRRLGKRLGCQGAWWRTAVVNGCCAIGHGSSDAKSVASADRTVDYVTGKRWIRSVMLWQRRGRLAVLKISAGILERATTFRSGC